MGANLSPIRLDDYTLRILIELPITEHGRKFFEVVQSRHDEDLADLIDHPRICDDDFSRDHRYRMGWVACLKWILAMPKKASEEQLTRKIGG